MASAYGEQRQHQDRGGGRVGGPEHEPGDHGEQQAAADVDDAVEEHGDVVGVVAEVRDRLTGRAHGLAGLGSTAGELGREHVGPQERLHVHPRLRPSDRAELQGRHAQHLADGEQQRPPQCLRRLRRRQRVVPAPEQEPGDGGHEEEPHEPEPAEQEAARFVHGHLPCETPDVHCVVTSSASSASSISWLNRLASSASSVARSSCSNTRPRSNTTISSTVRRVDSR